MAAYVQEMQRHDDDLVRPIPIGDGDAIETRSRLERLTENDGRSRTRVVPLLTLLLAIVLMGSALAGITSFGSDDPMEEADESSREGSHLGPDDQLLVVAQATGDGWIVVWNRLQPPLSPTGSIGMIPSPSSPEAASRALDAGGTVLADDVCQQGSCTIVLTAADDPLVRVSTIEGQGFVWHAIEPLRLAWIDTDTGVPTVHTGRLDVETGTMGETAELFSVGAGDQLVRWDTTGFIVDGEATRAIGDEGSLLWEADADVLDATPAIVTLFDETSGAWSIVDRVGGAPVMASNSPSAAVSVVAVPAELRDATLGTDGYRYSMTLPAEGEDPSLTRAQWRLPIGSMAGGQYRIYRSDDGSRLTLRVQQPLDALRFTAPSAHVLAPGMSDDHTVSLATTARTGP